MRCKGKVTLCDTKIYILQLILWKDKASSEDRLFFQKAVCVAFGTIKNGEIPIEDLKSVTCDLDYYIELFEEAMVSS